jgi:hypothetical protein
VLGVPLSEVKTQSDPEQKFFGLVLSGLKPMVTKRQLAMLRAYLLSMQKSPSLPSPDKQLEQLYGLFVHVLRFALLLNQTLHFPFPQPHMQRLFEPSLLTFCG